MDIPYGQVELIQEVVKANPRTIVVMIAGSPLNMAAVGYLFPGYRLGLVQRHGRRKLLGGRIIR